MSRKTGERKIRQERQELMLSRMSSWWERVGPIWIPTVETGPELARPALQG